MEGPLRNSNGLLSSNKTGDMIDFCFHELDSSLFLRDVDFPSPFLSFIVFFE